jgi:hypothetical protein
VDKIQAKPTGQRTRECRRCDCSPAGSCAGVLYAENFDIRRRAHSLHVVQRVWPGVREPTVSHETTEQESALFNERAMFTRWVVRPIIAHKGRTLLGAYIIHDTPRARFACIKWQQNSGITDGPLGSRGRLASSTLSRLKCTAPHLVILSMVEFNGRTSRLTVLR